MINKLDELKNIALTMTKEEFIEHFFNEKGFCPDELGLKRIICNTLNEPCRECVENSIKDFKFKDI
jgi:hypothetical protein